MPQKSKDKKPKAEKLADDTHLKRSTDNKGKIMSFLDDVLDRPFGMVVFFAGPEGMQASHLFRHVEGHSLSMSVVGSSHALWKIAEEYTVEEVAKLLEAKGILTFSTETKGRG